MNLAERAYMELYPGKKIEHSISLKYSGKFKAYNANVRMRGDNLIFNLSKSWRKVSKEIQIGLIQSLLIKVLKDKKKTTNMDLYDIFMKKVHLIVPKTNIDSVLEKSFDRVNEGFFYGLVEKPNLVWGSNSRMKLGSYEYGTDTITISSIFRNARKELLDYIMYHEVLHKKHKFYSKNGRSYHHTREFRKKEKEFPDREEIERAIKALTKRFWKLKISKPFWKI